MSLGSVFDIVIGLVFIFLVFSLLVSGAHELVARALATRSKHLWRTLRELLDGKPLAQDSSSVIRALKVSGRAVIGIHGQADTRPGVDAAAQADRPSGVDAAAQADEPSGEDPSVSVPWVEKLYQHPLIRKLDETTTFAKTRLRHIEANDFTRALLDIVIKDQGWSSVEKVDQAIKELKAIGVAAPFIDDLSVLVRQAAGNFDQLRSDVNKWFDARMDALSKAYRKRTRWWLFVLGIFVAVGFNVDALNVTQALYRDEALRNAISTQAIALVGECQRPPEGQTEPLASDDPEVIACVDDRAAAVSESIDLPVWHTDGFQVDASSLLGWLIAAAALAQGGPFWFDALRKLSGLKQGFKST